MQTIDISIYIEGQTSMLKIDIFHVHINEKTQFYTSCMHLKLIHVSMHLCYKPYISIQDEQC